MGERGIGECGNGNGEVLVGKWDMSDCLSSAR